MHNGASHNGKMTLIAQSRHRRGDSYRGRRGRGSGVATISDSGLRRSGSLGSMTSLTWYLVYFTLSLALLVIAFLPWFVLDDTNDSISIAEIMLYALDGPDRNWLMQETGVYGPLFLVTPFLLVPFLTITALRAANERTPSSAFIISLIGFGLICFGASAAVEHSRHIVAHGFAYGFEYGFVMPPKVLFAVAFISLLGFAFSKFEMKITLNILKPLILSRSGLEKNDAQDA